MIYVESKGGLGNQLYLANVAFRLYRELELSVRLDCSWHQRKGNRRFELPNHITKECSSSIGSYNIRRLLAKQIRVADSTEYSFSTISNQITGSKWQNSFRLKGFFQSDSLVSEEFVKLLRGCIEEINLSGNVIQSLRSGTLIHVRLGDYLTNPSFSVIISEYLRQALMRCQPSSAVVMTDSVESLSIFPELMQFPVLDTSSLNSIELMSLSRHTKHFIGSNSTLSRWISYLVRNYGGSYVLPVSNSGCRCCIQASLISKDTTMINVHV